MKRGVKRGSPTEKARARTLREQGINFSEIARKMHRNHSTIEDWIKRTGLKDKTKVGHDGRVWRIYYRDCERDPEGHSIAWWPLMWLQFENCPMAEAYLEAHREELEQ